jgi:hypothetical protein
MVSAGNLFSVTQIQNGKRGWFFLAHHSVSQLTGKVFTQLQLKL